MNRLPGLHRALRAAGILLALAAGSGNGAETPSTMSVPAADLAFIDTLPPYVAAEPVEGTIRLWGHGSFKRDFMGNLVDAWVGEFRQQQPSVRFENRMYGTASAVGALYSGVGDIAILGEEISPAAARAFERAKGYPPTAIPIATGSVDVNFFDYAHMVFVHKDNPLRQLSLQQLDAIFGTEHRRGDRNIRDWGQLGLGESWKGRRIQPYGWKTDVDFALFFRERVLGDSHRWNPDIREFVHATRADGSQYDHGQQILDALGRDPAGIAISNLRYATPEVRALALAWEPQGPWLAATPASLIAQTYPLVRIIPAIIDRKPGQPIRPAVREFLRYLLSRDGQRQLVRHSGYLPLGAAALAEQRGRLQ